MTNLPQCFLTNQTQFLLNLVPLQFLSNIFSTTKQKRETQNQILHKVSNCIDPTIQYPNPKLALSLSSSHAHIPYRHHFFKIWAPILGFPIKIWFELSGKIDIFFLRDLLWLTRRSTVKIAWTNTTARNTKTPPPRRCRWRTLFRCAVLDLEQVRSGASLEIFDLSLSLGLCLIAQKILNSNFTF